MSACSRGSCIANPEVTDYLSSRPDVGREVLAGKGGAGGDEVGGRTLEDDPAAVVAGAGPRSMIQSACAMTAR